MSVDQRIHPSYWVKKLDLQPHPEGGFYKEVYRSNERVQSQALPKRYQQERSFATSIYFLLTSDSFSAFHRVNSDEGWHFYWGSSLTLHCLSEHGHQRIQVGNNPETGDQFQTVIPAGTWFAAEVNQPGGFSLVGCTVAPGFDFVDFELADRVKLSAEFPQHQDLIKRFTRL